MLFSNRFSIIQKSSMLSLLLILFSISFPLHSQILHVPQQYSKIQAAINAADSGDTILVAPGIYYENLHISAKEIVLAGYYLTDKDQKLIEQTIIDGSQPKDSEKGSVIMITGGSTPEEKGLTPYILGFTITGGTGTTLVDSVNTVEGRHPFERKVGGGFYIENMNPVFTKNRIVNNQALIHSFKDAKRRRVSKGEDIGGGGYAFNSKPNFGGDIDGADIHNPGGNIFINNYANIGKTFFAHFDSNFEGDTEIKFDNCCFDVFNYQDTALSIYWLQTPGKCSFQQASGRDTAITTDIYVSPVGNDDTNSGKAPDKPFKTINKALGMAYGDSIHPIVIHLAEGVYSPSTNGEAFPLQMVEWVSIHGAGKHKTILDGEGDELHAERIMIFNDIKHVSVHDLTIKGGFKNVWNPAGGGGAIYMNNSGPVFKRLLITENYAGFEGGAVYCYHNSNPYFQDVEISHNMANRFGGALFSFASNPTFQNVIIKNNVAKYASGGGAYCCYSHPTFTDVQFIANSAEKMSGGAIYLNEANPSFQNVLFSENSAQNGGAVYCDKSKPRILHSKIISNIASEKGGGIYCFHNSDIEVHNVLFYDNVSQIGAAVFAYGSNPLLNRTTIVQNAANLNGGGMYSYLSNPLIINSLVWDNTPQELFLLSNDAFIPDSITIAYSDIKGGRSKVSSGMNKIVWLYGNIDAEPLFVNNEVDKFLLTEQSPAIDAGVAQFKLNNQLIIDLDEDAFHGNAPDMGAFESQYTTEIIPFQSTNSTIRIYPNPCQSFVTIEFVANQHQDVRIKISDVTGRTVKRFTSSGSSNSHQSNRLIWNISSNSNIPGGVYFVQVEANNNLITKKLIIK